MLHTGFVGDFNGSLPHEGPKLSVYGLDNKNGIYLKVLAADSGQAAEIGRMFLEYIQADHKTIHTIRQLDFVPQLLGVEKY